MKHLIRVFAIVLLFSANVNAQEADWNAAKKSILNFSNGSSETWIKHYEALQNKETNWFNRDTFTMTWHLEPSNLVLKATGNAKTPWQAHYNPTFAGNVTHPVWHTYELATCVSKVEDQLFLQDFDLVYILDSNYKVLKVQPELMVLRGGKSRKFAGNEVSKMNWEECMQVAFQGEEANKPYLVGQRWRKTAKFIAAIEQRKPEIEAAIAEAIRAKYTTAEVNEVLSCPESVLECYDFPDPANGYCRAEGLFTAKSGPKELFYSALIALSEEGEISVEIENIWK